MSIRAMAAAAWGLLFCIPAGAQPHNVLTAQEQAEGFELLFDGTLASFKANFVDYVKDSVNSTGLSLDWTVDTATGAVGNKESTMDLRSKRIFKDFDLRMEYRCDGNSGVFYRTLLNTPRAWATGIEYDINDFTGNVMQEPGAASELFSPYYISYYPYNTGKWNVLRIVAVGDSIEHWMNGYRVLNFKLHSTEFWRAYSVSKWGINQTMTFNTPGNRAGGFITQGYLGIQGDWGGKLQIRNLRIKDLAGHTALRRSPGGGKVARGRAGAGVFHWPVGDAAWSDLNGRIRPAPIPLR